MLEDKKLIVYLAKYDDYTFWACISNFLHKFYCKEELKLSEVSKVFTTVLQDRKESRELLKEILSRKDSFRAISKPENLYDVDENYESLFCIYIQADQISELVELQKLYMICRQYEKKRILAIVDGDDKNYFKISHFLKWVNIQNEVFYNCVYYHNIKSKKGPDILRMERSRAAAFERILPLLEIDVDIDKMLRTPLRKLAEHGEFEAALDGNDISISKLDLKNSALRQLRDRRDAFKNCERQELIAVLQGINLLTLILFADSLAHQKKTYKDLSEVRMTLGVLKRHVQGYLQLIENILFHTKEKVGVFCLRLLDGNAKYIRDKYMIPKEDGKALYFEISISDYSGNEENGNLAQTFISKLEDSSLRHKFERLKPIHFFQGFEEMDETIRNAWKRYYYDVEHVGRHYGLRIFQTLVSQAGGMFVVESHSTHRASDGECVGRAVKDELCMPGTAYSILMPMDFDKQYVNEQTLDFGIKNAIEYKSDINEISSIDVRPLEGEKLMNSYINEEDKVLLVNEMADLFGPKSQKPELVAVDAAEIPERNAELIYKALIQAASNSDQTKFVAFYNCHDEFVNGIWEVAYSLFETMASQYILHRKELQIIFFTQNDYEELIIVPDNYERTVLLNNKINFTRETKWKDLFFDLSVQLGELWGEAKKYESGILPFDVMIRPEIDGEKLTIFEYYTRSIVDRNIQHGSLGCKFEETHMRLGSTIHVGQFYEAEFLFGINLFVERFALLMALDLKDRLAHVDKLTLYGYAAYSEQLIYKLKDYIHDTYKNIDIDYVVLERESQERGTVHTDKIRYSTFFANEEKRQEYFRDRKLICIIPISSTLKTNEKLINMFCEQNGEECRDNILEDYEVILVGNRENNYWRIVDSNRITSLRSSALKWNPRFFIQLDMKYEESLQCKMCFPENVLDEMPLIEVNAASTIPNQAFGLQNTDTDVELCTPEKINELEEEMRLLKDCFLYSHTKNGEAHFLFYVQTNLLMIRRRSEIENWLNNKKSEVAPDKDAYNIIFCPTHARNVGFAECINKVVFDSSAIIIHDDVDKEYRSNFAAKYSNLSMFVRKIAQEGQEKKIRFFYADNSVITGRSFHRAKSLLKSIVKDCFREARKEYCIFDSVFVLIDRNSQDNRKMYVGNNWGKHFFAYCTLHISSLRTHGDACVLCNLEHDADRLKKSSVSTKMYKYWEGQKEKFAPDNIEVFMEGEEYKNRDKRERAFRRLVCANEAGVFLNEKSHGNHKAGAMVCILQMIVNGCNRSFSGDEYDAREELQREYFLSYCKILSRPFVVFNKAVKEAVFDFLLIFTESILNEKSVSEVITENEKKTYIQDDTIVSLLIECEELIQNIFLKFSREMELLNVLLKQLTELKSNYIIRLVNMNKIVKYINRFSEDDQIAFYERYLPQVKKLLGVSSDTSKSAWFDYLLSFGKECGEINNQGAKLELPDLLYEQLYIENNRVVSDAISKLWQIVNFSDEEKAIFNKKNFLSGDVVSYDEYVKMDITNRLRCQAIYPAEENTLKSIGEKISNALSSYLLKDYYEVLKSHTGGDYRDRKHMLPVAAQILLYQYIDQNFGDNQLVNGAESSEERGNSLPEQGKQIAIYLNYILHAKTTYILLESMSEADAWEDTIIEKFNVLATQRGKKDLELELKCPKEYLLLGSSWEDNRNMVFNNRKLARYLKEVSSDEGFKLRGYYFTIDGNEKILIWRLGMKENQVYVCSELEVGRTREEYLNDIRNALQFSYQLNHRVFNVNNTAFFTEIISAAKNLSYSLGEKIVTHTPYMIRMQQFLELDKNENEGNNRKTDIIMLLADSNISEHYRQSLHKEYYIRSKNSFSTFLWSDAHPVFTGEFPCSFMVPIGECTTRNKVIVHNEGFAYLDEQGNEHEEKFVAPEDRLIGYRVANSYREVVLMLYLMITNSAVEGRSHVENNCIDVYLSKTAKGELRISNKMNKAYRKRNDDLSFEIPPYDDEGISIWTLTRYLKSFAASTLNEKLLKLEEKSSDVTVEELSKLRTEIQELPKDVQVHIEYVNWKDEEYFSIVIPIFLEKFKQFF